MQSFFLYCVNFETLEVDGVSAEGLVPIVETTDERRTCLFEQEAIGYSMYIHFGLGLTSHAVTVE